MTPYHPVTVFTLNFPAMRTHNTRLSRRCPACGGRGHAEARLPVGSAARPGELDLDDPRGLTDRLTLGTLLALVEALPYKMFTCQRCRHEFRMENRSSKEQLFSMLSAMQPVAATPPEKRRRSARLPVATPAPVRATAPGTVVTPHSRPIPERAAAPNRPESIPRPAPAAPEHVTEAEDWEPYHLDHDLDALFDQFEAPESRPSP